MEGQGPQFPSVFVQCSCVTVQTPCWSPDVGLCTRGFSCSLRVPAKGSKCKQGGEVIFAAGSTSVSSVLSQSMLLCTESGQAGPARGRLASEECSGASGSILGEQTSSHVLQLL